MPAARYAATALTSSTPGALDGPAIASRAPDSLAAAWTGVCSHQGRRGRMGLTERLLQGFALVRTASERTHEPPNYGMQRTVCGTLGADFVRVLAHRR